MATSNLVKAIGNTWPILKMRPSANGKLSDTAFVDRADVIQYIDFPTAQAIYDILRSSLVELMKKGIVDYLVSFAFFFFANHKSNDLPHPAFRTYRTR